MDAQLRIEALQLEFGEGPCITAYQTGKRVLIPDLAADVRYPRFSPAAREAGLGAVFTFPMSVDGRPLGALDVYRAEPRLLAIDDASACQILGDIAASYVYNARVHAGERAAAEEYRERSLHDSLTGLPNRVLLHDRLHQAVAKSQRSRATVAVLLIDLDRFKLVNERHGHCVGDQVLVAVTDRLLHALPERHPCPVIR